MKNNTYDFGMLFIRLVLGIIFLVHGLKKIRGMQETIQRFYDHYGIPIFLMYVVTFIEVTGGALLILGLFTRIAALAITTVMIGAIYFVTWDKGFINGYEFDLALLAMAISLLFRKTNESEKLL